MSTVVLQIGQGGNQYGLAFFDALAKSGSGSSFFSSSSSASSAEAEVEVARAVLVDMEPKVVAGVVRKADASKIWKYGEGNRYTLESGSANNWAAGYSNGAASHDALMQRIRAQVEGCDCFGGFLGIQSLAGGTGAGFGAYLLEAVKEEYPSACIFSHCIWPYHTGEVVVQNYNLVLTLAKLQEVADGIIIVHNEALAAACKRSLGISRPSFSDMNNAGAHSLASVFLPSNWRRPASSAAAVRLLSDVANALCAHPAYRILGLYSTPQIRSDSVDFTTFTWSAQLRQLKRIIYPVQLQQLPGETRLTRSVQKAVASLLVLRGEASSTADVNIFNDPSLYPSWSIDPLNVAAHDAGLGACRLVAGMITNCQSPILPAANVLARAYSMYFSKAYLHQYFQHGLDSAFFEASFATVEDVLLAYKSLS